MKSEQQLPYKNNRFLLKFVTSYSIILLFILIMGSFFYYFAINNSEKSLHKQNTSLLSTNVRDIDDTIRLFSTLSTQISSNSDIKQLLYYTERDVKYYLQAKSAMKYLTNIMSLGENLPIMNYYIYFPNTDYFMSATTFSDAERFYLYNKQYSRSEYENWHNMISSYDNMQEFIPLNAFKKDSNLFLYKQMICPNIVSPAVPGILYIEISMDNLKNTFSTLSLGEDCSLYCVNQDGSPMFTLTNGEHLTYHPSEIAAEFINETDEDTYTNNKKYFITKITSGYNQWTYYLIQPSSFLLKDFYLVQKLYLGIILFTCAFTLIIIYFLSKQNIKPILKMNDELQSSKVENESLHTALELQRPYVYNAYLNRIMKGHISSSADLAEIVSFLNIETTDRSYAVLYTKVELLVSPSDDRISSFHTPENNEGANELNALADYSDIITQCFKKYYGQETYIYKSDFSVYALLLAFPSAVATEDFVEECRIKFNMLHQDLYDHYQIDILGGFGKRNARLTYVWESYQQAKDAANYVREGNIFQYYYDLKRENTNYYYPLELANQLINFIHHSNNRQVAEIFKILRRENFEYRTLPVEILKMLVADLKNTLLKTQVGAVEDTPHNQLLLEKIDIATKQAVTFEDVEKLSQLYCSLYEKPVEKNPLIINIEDYINQNYADSSLCLKKISNEFNISESYFSTLFKNETQQNFSDYLEKLRMERAMYLVKTSDTSLSDIFMQVGYNNANSFRRAFKKIYGVSPKTVRDSAKEA